MGCGVRGTCGPRSGRAARQRGAGAQGGARAEQRWPSPHSAACCPPARPPKKGKDGDLRVRSADRGPHPAPREAASGSPGCGVHGRSTTSTPAAQAPPRPGDPGLPRMLCPGPGRGAGPCSAKGEQRRDLGGALSLDSFTASTQRRQPPRRDTPARAAAPAWRPPAPPCHSPGAHTPPAPLAPACTHAAADHASLGFVSAHTHVLTQIPSLHPPSLDPFPPYFLEESPLQLPHFAGLPRTNLHPFPSKPPPPMKLPTVIRHWGHYPPKEQENRVFFFPTQENELCCPSTLCKGEMLLPVEGSNAFWG